MPLLDRIGVSRVCKTVNAKERSPRENDAMRGKRKIKKSVDIGHDRMLKEYIEEREYHGEARKEKK